MKRFINIFYHRGTEFTEKHGENSVQLCVLRVSVVSFISFLLPILLLLLADLTFAQSDATQFQYFDKGKNIIGLQLSGNGGANMIIGGASLRYGRFWLNKLNAGLESGFSLNGQYSSSYYFKPFGRYYILNRSFSPFVETNYSFRVTTKSYFISEDLKQIENAVFALGGLAYTGIFKWFGIEGYAGYYYAISYYVNHPKDNKYNKDIDYVMGLRINFHF